MALIYCPQCGHPNVSDSAEKCPNCGCNIKNFFLNDKIKKQQRIITTQKREEQQKKLLQCPECNRFFDYSLKICPYCGLSMEDKESINRLHNINRLEERIKDTSSLTKNLLICLVSFAAFIVFLLLYILTDSGFILTLCFTGALLSVVFLVNIFIYFSDKNKDKKKLEIAKRDYTSYKKIEEQEFNRLIQSINSNKIEIYCPYCKSSNVQKITTSSRVGSSVMFGIASKKMGKQWHCNTCKSDF